MVPNEYLTGKNKMNMGITDETFATMPDNGPRVSGLSKTTIKTPMNQVDYLKPITDQEILKTKGVLPTQIGLNPADNVTGEGYLANLLNVGDKGSMYTPQDNKLFFGSTGAELGQLGLGTIGLGANIYDTFWGTGGKLREQDLKSKRQAYEFDKQRIQDYTRHADAMRKAGLMD
jgi:hypothetical protein